MTDDDLDFVVEQHRHHFPEGFWARLGPRFLHEYYRAFLTSDVARSVIADLDGSPVGYLVGVTDPAAHREHSLRQHGRALMRRATIAMLRRPSLAACFVRTRALRYARKLLSRRRPLGSPAGTQTLALGILTHIAVAPDTQSRGIGTSLIDWFVHEAATAGCHRLQLVTAAGDEGAGPYYERHGWRPRGQHRTPDGVTLITYERAVETALPKGTEPLRHGQDSQ